MIAISKYNKQHPLRVSEAFAGYGSQSLAFKYLKDKHPEFDFKVVGYSEIEPSAIQAYGQDHGNMVQRQPNHRNNARWLVVSTRLERNVGTINVPVRSHTRLIFTFAK